MSSDDEDITEQETIYSPFRNCSKLWDETYARPSDVQAELAALRKRRSSRNAESSKRAPCEDAA
jgi:hypothetical protein